MVDGYFPRGSSVLRHVMEQRVVSLHYGQRALIVGALEPLAFTGTYLHSGASRTGAYYDRMRRTHAMFEAVLLGDRAEADAALRRVAAMHAHVHGTLTSPISPQHPAGTTYRANDPWLSFFTMAVLADSAMALYDAYVGRLSAQELEDGWSDWRRFGELFGMPAQAAPGTWPEFRRTFEAWLMSDQPFLLPLARAAALASLNLPLPRPARPFNDLGYLIVVGTLPDRVRQLFRLPWDARHRLGHLVIGRAIRGSHRVSPALLREGRTGPAVKLVADYVDARSRSDLLERAARLSSV